MPFRQHDIWLLRSLDRDKRQDKIRLTCHQRIIQSNVVTVNAIGMIMAVGKNDCVVRGVNFGKNQLRYTYCEELR